MSAASEQGPAVGYVESSGLSNFSRDFGRIMRYEG